MARSVFQYEQPRCPDNWNEAERRFYNRLIETLDDIYSKYGRLDEKMLSKGVLNRIDNSTATSLEKMTADILSSGKIAADSIEATFAHLVSLSAKYGSFDFETVKNLVADAMVLEKGQADYVHITNLAATYAQAVNATIGNLVIQSSDGKYYQLDVSADGKVSASEVKPSDKEISAGETNEGKVIVGTHITAETLGTATLAATQALINMIDASRINVDTLVAREEFVQTLTANEAFVDSLVANTAFIKQLGTTTIVGDKSITMLAGEVDNLDRLSNIEVIEGTFAQTERREGEGIRIYSEIRLKQEGSGDPYPGTGNMLTVQPVIGTANQTLLDFGEDRTFESVTFSIDLVEASITTNAAVLNFQKADGTNEYVTNARLGVVKGTTYSESISIMLENITFRKVIGYFRSNAYSVWSGEVKNAQLKTPSNIRPIEGWTGLNAGIHGKNMFSGWVVGEHINSTTGAFDQIRATAARTDYISIKPSSNIRISGLTSTLYSFISQYDKDKGYLGRNGAEGRSEAAFTVPDNCHYLAIAQYENANVPGVIADLSDEVQVEYDEFTPYEPYQGNTYFLDFGGETVYGGDVDWHAGEIVVNRLDVVLNGTENFQAMSDIYNGTGRTFLPLASPGVATPINVKGDAICSHYPTITYNDINNSVGIIGIASYHASTHIAFRVQFDSVDDWKVYLAEQYAAGTPVQFSYELAEPYTIQLTPVHIETLQGINTVYTDADGGRVEFGHSPIGDIQSAVDALEEAQAESALYLKLDAENKVVRIGQTEVTSEFDIDAYGAGVVVDGKTFSRFEGERVLIGDMEMRKPANIGGLAFDSIMKR